jgi:hypothetical protein
LFAAQVAAQPTLALAPALTHHEQAAALGGATKAERLNWMRENVSEPWRLEKQFKNFEGKGYIEPTIPGVTKNVNALNSLSQQQAKGAARTLLFATKAYHDPRFQLVALDQPVNESYGRTDKDLVLRNRQTGQRVRVEVKDVKPASQRADLERIKGQIDKMAAEYRRTGELQAWANRQETIPAIKEYARQKGVPTYEKTKQTEFTKVLDDLERRSVVETRVKFAGSALSTGAGIKLLYDATRGLLNATHSDENDLTTNLRIGEQLSLLAAGGGYTASGVAAAASTPFIAEKLGIELTEKTLAKLGGITKWGGRAGIVGVILGEGLGIGIDYYKWDEMTARQRSVSKVQHSVSIGTLAVGFGIGFVAGLETGPGAFAFGLATAGASYAAGKVATSMVEDSYSRLDDAQKEQVRAFIYQHYGFSQ